MSHMKTPTVVEITHTSARLTHKLVIIKSGQCIAHPNNYSYGGAVLISVVLQLVTQGEYVKTGRRARIFTITARADQATATSRSSNRSK